jgi:hypothetical protein
MRNTVSPYKSILPPRPGETGALRRREDTTLSARAIELSRSRCFRHVNLSRKMLQSNWAVSNAYGVPTTSVGCSNAVFIREYAAE